MELAERGARRREVERVAAGAERRAVLGGEVGDQRPDGAESRAEVGKHDALAAEALGDRDGVDPGGATAADEHGIARVDPAAERDVLDRAHHVLGREPEHGDRGILGGKVQGPADVVLDRCRAACTSSAIAPPRK